MRNFTTTVTSNAASSTSVAASQTPSGASNLTLTSASVTFGSNSAQFVTIISGSNISNRTLTITGTNIYGAATSQTLTGPNNATVTSTLAFLTVTNVSISGAAAGALTVGNSAYAEGKMFVTDSMSDPFSVGFGTIITTSTPTWTIQHTFDDVLATPSGVTASATGYTYSSTSNVWFNHPIVASVTANSDGNYAFPVSAIRLVLAAAGAVRLDLYQSGGGAR